MNSKRCSVRAALIAAALAFACVGCGPFRQQADAKFGDQNFKSAIALIELHKVRFGSYPERLTDLTFIGDWDRIWISAVEYRKLDDGYELNVRRGWVGEPDLKYSSAFWRGLGIRKTNVKRMD